MLRNENVLKFFKTAYCFTDSQRNTAYENWISENVKDKIVIDLGAGSGILCYLAVKYGAKKVYALERKGRLIHRMKETLGDTIEYIHADLYIRMYTYGCIHTGVYTQMFGDADSLIKKGII